MRLLTATALTQGTRDNDYNCATEGELVSIDPMCDCDFGDPDSECGCGRGFAGMSSHRATTTSLVWDLDLTRADFRLALQAARGDSGWQLSVAKLDEEVDFLIRSARATSLDPADAAPVRVVFRCPHANRRHEPRRSSTSRSERLAA